ncbi:MAG: hypothetical protein AMXMBFR53_25970 [Gemmatimonadota bacterium]
MEAQDLLVEGDLALQVPHAEVDRAETGVGGESVLAHLTSSIGGRGPVRHGSPHPRGGAFAIPGPPVAGLRADGVDRAADLTPAEGS